MTAVSNGSQPTVLNKMVVLPTSIEVEVAGAKFFAQAVPTVAGGIKYQAAQEKAIGADDTRSFEEILAGLVGKVKHEGVEVPVSKKYRDVASGNLVIRPSEPIKRKDGSITGGGDPMLSFWKALPDLGVNGYTFRVTCKGIVTAAGRVIRVTVAIAPSFGPASFKPKGAISGEMSL